MTTSVQSISGTRALPRVVLASASARRRDLLQGAGIEFRVRPATLDDGELSPPIGVDPAWWVMALAHLKARSSLKALDPALDPDEVILGADTICVHDGAIIGQPRDRAHAREIIDRMNNSEHDVLTGVAILGTNGEVRELFVDRSVVRVGDVPNDRIESYLDSGDWRGKAGAYNISERLEDDWPMSFEGCAHSIAGLPLSRVIEHLEHFA